MYIIRVTNESKDVLPERMLYAVNRHRRLGCLDELVHVKDDITQKTEHGWEMLSYWGKPEEVNKL